MRDVFKSNRYINKGTSNHSTAFEVSTDGEEKEPACSLPATSTKKTLSSMGMSIPTRTLSYISSCVIALWRYGKSPGIKITIARTDDA